MLQQLQQQKQILDPFLLNLLDELALSFQDQQLSEQAFVRIKAFVISGKSIRGGLFLLAAESLDQDNFQKHHLDLLQVAAALEIIHSGLLMHDDIIDQDEKRRNLNSIWHDYELDAIHQNYHEPKNYGQSQAICLGGISLYLANLALDRIGSGTSNWATAITAQVRQIISQEIIKTYFAEMLDSAITSQSQMPTQTEVLEMYRYKTARYTFSLPLLLASIVSHSPMQTQQKLALIGEKLGLIFQIKDDEIGLFAPESTSGKSFASDIREGKKTIFYLSLLRNINANEQQLVYREYGNKSITRQSVIQLQNLFQSKSAPEVSQLVAELEQDSLKLIETVTPPATATLLREILDFNLQRTY